VTTNTTLRNALVIGAMTVAVAGFTSSVQADDATAKEKCYSVVKAGKNDCKSGTHKCTGHATKDGEGFVMVPKGLCEKLVGGSLSPTK